MSRQCKNDVIWKTKFGQLLKHAFITLELDYTDFCHKYNWSTSTFRYWTYGRNLPQRKALFDIKEYLIKEVGDKLDHKEQIFEDIHAVFEEMDENNTYYRLSRLYSQTGDFVSETLSVLFSYAKNDFSFLSAAKKEMPPTGKIQAVIFDFDGTLTVGKTNRTTWESLWIGLGYDVKECQDLHLLYDRKEITHPEWCKLTEKKFCDRNLHIDTLKEIASSIELIKGIKETFEELKSKNISIYIVSGSILTIIETVLDDLNKYVVEIKANHFKFDRKGFLYEIVGTKYDFEGKADYIFQVANDLGISTKDILFVGNSINDRFAYISGAKTLCINPHLTDISNRRVWNDCLTTCESLTEILKYI